MGPYGCYPVVELFGHLSHVCLEKAGYCRPIQLSRLTTVTSLTREHHGQVYNNALTAAIEPSSREHHRHNQPTYQAYTQLINKISYHVHTHADNVLSVIHIHVNDPMADIIPVIGIASTFTLHYVRIYRPRKGTILFFQEQPSIMFCSENYWLDHGLGYYYIKLVWPILLLSV